MNAQRTSFLFLLSMISRGGGAPPHTRKETPESRSGAEEAWWAHSDTQLLCATHRSGDRNTSPTQPRGRPSSPREPPGPADLFGPPLFFSSSPIRNSRIH